MPPEKARRLELAGLTAVVTVAAVVRLWRLGQGLPEAPHVDAFKFVAEAGRMLASGDWRPQLLQHPQLYPRLLALLAAAFGADGELARHLVGRTLSAVAGIAAVPAAWRLGGTLAGASAAVLAALVVALDPGAVTYSRVVAPDALMVALVAWALVLLVASRRRLMTTVGAGILLGLAVAVKLSALALLPWLIVAPMVLAEDRRRWRPWLVLAAAGVLAAVLAAAAASPHLVLDAGGYLHRLAIEASRQRGGQIGRVQADAFDLVWSRTPTWEQPWLGTSLAANLGLPLVGLGLAGGALLLLGRGGRRGFVVAGFAGASLAVVVGPGHLKAYRFLLPALPGLAAAAGWAAARLAARCGRWQRVVTVGLMGVAVVVPGWGTARYLHATAGPTTVAVAKAWFADHVASGTTVFLAPFFTEALARDDLDLVGLPMVGVRQYRLSEEMGPSPEREPLYTAALVNRLRAHGVELVVLNSYFDDAFRPVPENLRYFPRSVAEYRGFRVRLEANAALVWSVEGWSAGRIGPDIEVWRLRR